MIDALSGAEASIALPVVNLLRSPEGPRDRQLLLGDRVTLLEQQTDWVKIRAAKDGYCGYVARNALTTAPAPSHWISAPASHAYSRADFKSAERCALSLGSRLCVIGEKGRFAKTDQGYVPLVHLSPLSEQQDDPVAVAESLLGTPYLWGGNSRFGIDCSGLVQAGCLACGIVCPGDSGPQERSLGTLLPKDSAYQRGDLLFWKGHVAWVRDSATLLHANVHAMAVAVEPIAAAITRIQQQGDGPVTSHKRLMHP